MIKVYSVIYNRGGLPYTLPMKDRTKLMFQLYNVKILSCVDYALNYNTVVNGLGPSDVVMNSIG